MHLRSHTQTTGQQPGQQPLPQRNRPKVKILIQQDYTTMERALAEIDVKFKGGQNDNAIKWLEMVESRFSCFDGISDPDKRKKISLRLEDDALTWYEENKANKASWADFKQAMIAKYPSALTPKLSFIRINDYEARQQQDNESVTSYYIEKINLANMASPSIPDNMLVSALIKGLLPLYHQQLYGTEQEMQWLSSHNQQQSTNISYPSEDQYIQPSVNAIRQRHHCTTITRQNVNLKPPVYFQNNNNQQPRLDSTLLMNPRSDDHQRRPWNRNSQQYYSVQQYQRQQVVPTCYGCVQPGHIQRHCHLNRRGGQKMVKRNNLRTTIMADISTTICTDLILGTDWCSKYDVNVCFSSKTVKIGENRNNWWQKSEIKFEPCLDEEINPVRLINTVIIQPHTEQLTEITVPVRQRDTMIFSPDHQLQQLRWIMMPNAVVKIDDYHSIISITNPTDNPKMIFRNTVIGVIRTPPVESNYGINSR
ncbi:unnamed protein product [Didymodactylos carnosus]|uniref:CCHC-type domain-containing protein n=1 Tax=Didymodactylos carnosus TaxID=1234261 RepID=A0A815QD67_9BILA|nr:unnamed protein product [Didymodactylos carnosus]CAF4331576.1 unnamed protein product [Didymodactylos carnosus]